MRNEGYGVLYINRVIIESELLRVIFNDILNFKSRFRGVLYVVSQSDPLLPGSPLSYAYGFKPASLFYSLSCPVESVLFVSLWFHPRNQVLILSVLKAKQATYATVAKSASVKRVILSVNLKPCLRCNRQRTF